MGSGRQGRRLSGDAELRALERAYVECPDDPVALERLQDARIRRGFGWRGEKLPENDQGVLVPSDERGVYVWKRQEEGYPHRELMQIEFVYVPEGEVSCDHWLMPGAHEIDDVSLSVPSNGLSYSLSTPGGCRTCVGTGTIKTAPFYIGLFPVTWGEFERYCRAVETRQGDRASMYHYPPRPSYATEHHPVVNVEPYGFVDAVTGKEAIPSFFDWSGLRLPTRFEWRWAALGPPDQDWHLLPRHYVSGSKDPGVYLCQKCGKQCFGLDPKCPVLSPRTYPWGCDPPRAPDRAGDMWSFIWPNCIFNVDKPEPVRIKNPEVESKIKELVQIKQQMVGSLYPSIVESQIEDLRTRQGFVPARPGGRSWRNVHDMAGNVFELVDSMLALGGSFRSTDMTGWPRATGPVREPRDDVGFRVAVSVVS